jgi:hypothetical protein
MWRGLIFAIILCRSTLFGLSTVQSTSPQKARGLRFLGRLEAINSTHKTLIVKHGPVQGYAERGIGVYKVDDETVLARLRPGDDISATVFPNDQTLYKIHVVYRRAQPRKAVKRTALFRDMPENRGSAVKWEKHPQPSATFERSLQSEHRERARTLRSVIPPNGRPTWQPERRNVGSLA